MVKSHPFPDHVLSLDFLIWIAPRMPLLNQELLIFAEAPGFTPSFHGVHVAQIIAFCVVFCRSLFVLFLLSIVLSVLRFTVSDYPFDIFKFFVLNILVFCIEYFVAFVLLAIVFSILPSMYDFQLILCYFLTFL